MSKQKPNLKVGDAIFFKRAKESSDSDAKFIEFSGHGFGVFLGAIPNEIHDPTPQILFQIMGSIGFCLFDDIVEFLGEEQGKLVLKKHEEKYNPVLSEEEKQAQMKAAYREKAPVIAQRPVKKIVGLDGKPIDVLPSPENDTTH